MEGRGNISIHKFTSSFSRSINISYVPTTWQALGIKRCNKIQYLSLMQVVFY